MLVRAENVLPGKEDFPHWTLAGERPDLDG